MTPSDFDCSHPVGIEEEPRHHLIVANEFVRAFAVAITVGYRTLCHHHPQEYLLYIASSARIVSAALGEEPKYLNYQDGECELSAAGLTHVVENLGDETFRNVVVELLPGSGKLRRGAAPTSSAGEARIDKILDEEPGAVFQISMQPGCEVEIAGPAVLASPYGDALMVKELDDFDIPLDSFRKLMWVCAPRRVAIKNLGQAAGRAIAFQIGHR